jgi:WhiB family transcriptional regulator, redox-sensing transcriptional regulator
VNTRLRPLAGRIPHGRSDPALDAGGGDPRPLLAILSGEDSIASDLGWQDQALCAEADPEIFHPEKGGSTREAKRVCRSCDVRAECLEYALDNDERFGIWGGMSERERRRLKRSAA